MDAMMARSLDQPASSWKDRYGERHRLVRVNQFPEGITAPKRVRIYRRRNHFILQWWCHVHKRTLSERIEGDLLAALVRAREIERDAEERASVDRKERSPDHKGLVERFLTDCGLRCEAGEIDARTICRYKSAFKHYLQFVSLPEIRRQYKRASSVDRNFQLRFASFLGSLQVSPNGSPNARLRPMRGQEMVMDTVRGLYCWASDPLRGNCLPASFANPFLRLHRCATRLASELAGEPPITTDMASDFVDACDDQQLRLFATYILFGARASEPCFLFAEDVTADWLHFPCRPELAYMTKGRREKRLPLIPELTEYAELLRVHGDGGPLFRRHVNGPLKSLSDIQSAMEKQSIGFNAIERQRLRDRLLRSAGGLSYDHIEGSFRSIASRLSWPSTATLKGFRHHFATVLENGGMPESYRRYLMGHAPGGAAIVRYTHLNKVREHYRRVMLGECPCLVQLINARAQTALARRSR